MPDRKLPIIIVPDKTYMDDKGEILPAEVLLIADQMMYEKMEEILGTWERAEHIAEDNRDKSK